MTLANELSLTFLEIFVKDFRLSLTNNCFDTFVDLSILFTTANDAPLSKDSFIKLLPSFFFPLMAKKISSFFIFFEFIDASFILESKGILFLISSFIIFTFQFLDKYLFFLLMYFKIIFLSEKFLIKEP